MRRWYFAGLWLAGVALIIWLANTGRAQPLFDWVKRNPGSDKAGHFILIGGMALLANLALRGRRVGWLQLGSLIVAVVFVAEEFSQQIIPSRTFDWGDLAADFAGIVFFDLVSRRILRSPRPSGARESSAR